MIYEGCPVCGAPAKLPCVGSRFGPHEGRQTRWDAEAAATVTEVRRVGRSLAEEFEPGGRYADGGEYPAIGETFRYLTSELIRLQEAGCPPAALRELQRARSNLLDLVAADDALRPHTYVITEGG